MHDQRLDQGAATTFDLKIQEQGLNMTVVVPTDYEGTVAGKCRLSPLLAERSTCVLRDAKNPFKNRYSIAAPSSAGRKSYTGQPGDEGTYSSIANVKAEGTRASGPGDNGEVFVCLPEEYTAEQRDRDTREGEFEISMAGRAWPIRFVGLLRRVFVTYGSTSDKVLYSILALCMILMGVGMPLCLIFGDTPSKGDS